MSPNLVLANQPAVATTITEAPEESGFLAFLGAAVRDASVDVAKLRELLEMRDRERARVAALAYRTAMSQCQAELEAVRSDAFNPQTRSKYATLANVDRVVRPVFTRHGLSVSFNTAETDKTDSVRVICTVAHIAGHTENFFLDMPTDGKGIKGNAMMTATHSLASAISYSRRYLLCMAFGVAISNEDDDGNAAGHGRPAPHAARPTPGRHADEQANRFYREPDHDQTTGEVFEDPAQAAEDEAANESREAFLSSTREIIRRASDPQELGRWWNSYEQKKARRDFDLTKEEVADLVAFVKARLAQLRQLQAAE
jgi:hypothetical protein